MIAKKQDTWLSLVEEALAMGFDELKAGEPADAERRARAISVLAKAARDAAEWRAAYEAANPEEDVETVRAELRRRFALFVEAGAAQASDEMLEAIALGRIPE